MASLPTITIGPGFQIPAIAYGTGTQWFQSDNASLNREAVEAIKTAIQVGYRHFDCAQMYNTERELGVAISESGLARSQFFITTKAEALNKVERTLRTSLEKLGLDYVDMYMIHNPFAATSPADLQSAWKGMERCVDLGLTRYIGVSNCTIRHLDIILDVASMKPVINQFEIHPYLQQPELMQYLEEKSIIPMGFAPLTPLTSASPGPVADVCKSLSEKHSVSESAILLRWVLDQNAAVVTTSKNRERLEGYLREVSSLKLDEEDSLAITAAGRTKVIRGFFKEEFEAFK